MVEGGIVAAASCQALVIPPRNATEAFLHGGSDDVTPSPMTFVSSLFAEHDPYTDVKPFSHSGAMASPTFPILAGEPNFFHNINQKDSDSNIPNHNNHGEIPVMRTSGDGKETIKSLPTAKYKSMMPSRLPVTSACLTIPPGLSPTMLLESPILFSNGQAVPSPTTGSFLASLNVLDGNRETESSQKNENTALQHDNFVFRPHPVLANTGFTPANGMGSFGIRNQADFKQETKPMEPHVVSQKSSGAFSELSDSSIAYMKNQGFSETAEMAQDTEPAKVSSETETILAHHGLSLNGRTSSDGYNWKKYGQKQLKGTERPRSYYKCTHPNCPVKKHVECTDEGEITEITYKGEHNHARPQTTRRASRNAAQMILDRSERGAHLQSYEGSFERVDSDKQSADFSSSSVAVSHAGLIGTPEQSFCSPSDEDYEAKSDMEENGEDEQDSKRRRIENGGDIMSSYPPPIRTVREPRVVVQTVSEVDILDDGYRWRKYGQKVVKGHTYPRSYYKCTNIGCGVRKHVERSSTDHKSVRTTYEGKHNHDVPLPRSNI